MGGGDTEETEAFDHDDSTRHTHWRFWLVITGLMVGAVFIGYAVVSSRVPPAPAAGGPSPRAVPADNAEIIPGSGTYLVGVDVHPGVYRTQGREAEDQCSWQLRQEGGKRAMGSLDEGRVVVRLDDDQVFITRGCNRWTRIRGLRDPATHSTPSRAPLEASGTRLMKPTGGHEKGSRTPCPRDRAGQRLSRSGIRP